MVESKNKKGTDWSKFTLPILVLSALVIGVGAGVYSPLLTGTPSVSKQVVQYDFGSMVCPVITRADGTVETLPCKHNLFTNQGQNITRNLLGSLTGAVVDVIGLGNNTVAQAATDTDLTGVYTTCGMSKQAGTYNPLTAYNGNWTIQANFTSTCNNWPVNETGLFNQTAAGGLFSENTFTTATLQNGDQISITWYIWVQ